MENKNNEEKIEEAKETKAERVKAFCGKIKKHAIKVGVVVLAFVAGATADALIQRRKDSSEEDKPTSGRYPLGENENTEEDNVIVEEPKGEEDLEE